jgi:putative drug exporter of the RND superfamily
MKGALDRSQHPREAILAGLVHSGRVIFAAGAVMVAGFLTFALSGPLPPKRMGIILGIAVLLDAASTALPDGRFGHRRDPRRTV